MNFSYLLFFSFYFKWRKFTFSGKSYKIIFKKKKFKFIFNRSHKTWYYFNRFLKIVKKKKRLFRVNFFLYKDLGLFIGILKVIRRRNGYTLRGLRISKSFVFRRYLKRKSYRS